MNALSLRPQSLPAHRPKPQPPRALLRAAIASVETDRRRRARTGWLWIGLCMALLLAAVSWVQIDGAIALSGQVRAGGEPVPVRTEMGGRLAQVLVRAGDRVTAGQPLLRLDRREDEALARDLDDRTARLRARLARLQALIDGTDMTTDGPPDVMQAERQLFEAERLADAEEAALAEARARGIEAQLVQLEARSEAQARELRVTRDELAGLRSLLERGLTAQARVRGLERLVESLRAEIAASESERAALASRQAEIAQDRSARQAARRANWLADWQASHAELDDRLAERERLALAAHRAEIAAPLAGTVVNAKVRSPGTVIAAGETLMEIVASDAASLIQANIPARDIERVHQGMTVSIDLSPLDPVGGGTLPGQITHVAADAVTDDRGQPTYAIEIAPEPGSPALPVGAPVRVLIPTETQSLLAQLIAPLRQRLEAALAER